MDVIHSPHSTTIDSTDIPKDKLDLDFLFEDEQLQRKFREIAKHFKVNKQCKTSCFLIGIYLALALLLKYGVDLNNIIPSEFAVKYRISYYNIYTLYKNCGKFQFVCSVCTNLVSLEMYDFVQSFRTEMLFAPFGFIQTVVIIYTYLQKKWSACPDGCYPWTDVPPGNFSIKCCLTHEEKRCSR